MLNFDPVLALTSCQRLTAKPHERQDGLRPAGGALSSPEASGWTSDRNKVARQRWHAAQNIRHTTSTPVTELPAVTLVVTAARLGGARHSTPEECERLRAVSAARHRQPKNLHHVLAAKHPPSPKQQRVREPWSRKFKFSETTEFTEPSDKLPKKENK